MITALLEDEQTMLVAMAKLRSDNYASENFNGKPDRYNQLFTLSTKPCLYASRRYLIPFGWYANPIPSTCATAWMIMVANHYNPFLPGGGRRSLDPRLLPSQDRVHLPEKESLDP